MKDTKHIRRDFYSVAWVIFFKHGHVAYQIDGDDEQNRMPVTFLSYDQTGDLGARSKVQISLTCQFQRFFIPNFVCVLTNKR